MFCLLPAYTSLFPAFFLQCHGFLSFLSFFPPSFFVLSLPYIYIVQIKSDFQVFKNIFEFKDQVVSLSHFCPSIYRHAVLEKERQAFEEHLP